MNRPALTLTALAASTLLAGVALAGYGDDAMGRDIVAGDGLVAEDHGPCDTTIFSECIVDLWTGATRCDNGDPLAVVSTSGGLVLRADMANWTAMVATADVDLPPAMSDNWALNIGNSPSNNGWGGDGSEFANDTEVQLWNNGVQVIQNDFGVNVGEPQILAGFGPATDLSGDLVEATVCDGYFAWDSSTSTGDVTDPHLFQIDGDEADFQASANDYSNDTYLWIGVGRTIGWAGRNGTGVQTLTLTFWD
ncbi:MAG: hypothetical protein KDA24_26585 [Deltaproteobacteria bacterium]|nr:hypothetical protein [Deltaproteobacteria bacterium]